MRQRPPAEANGPATEKARNDALCKAVPQGRVADWVGELTEVSTNNEGKGVITVELAEEIKVGTWNNAFSDLVDETLVDQDSPVYEALADLQEGDRVRFSGRLVSSNEDCFGEQSLTLQGKMTTPTFVLRFTKLSKV